MRSVMDAGLTRARIRRRASAVLVAMGLLILPAVAHADTKPVITQPPAITGTPQVDNELAAGAVWTGDPKPTATWAWQRCAKATGGCNPIAGAEHGALQGRTGGRRQIPAGAGEGHQRGRIGDGAVGADHGGAGRSDPDADGDAHGIARADRDACADRRPTCSGSDSPPVSAPVVVAPTALVPLALDPFPVVRIKGRLTSKGRA